MTEMNELKFGGDRISIPMVDPKLHDADLVTTPEWMIFMDDLLGSTIKGFEKYTELFGWYAEHSRETKGNVSGDLVSNACVKQSDVIVIIPMGLYIPKIDNIMTSGKVIEKISIVRIANSEDLKVPIQNINFTECQISKVQQRLKDAVITFRTTSRENIVTQYDQGGNKTGQTVSLYDYKKGE
jgi:hypothetical protein